MVRHAVMVVGLLLCSSAIASGQAADTPYQVRVVTNLKKKDTIHFTNSGASSTTTSPQNGKLCMNVYAFAGNGPMLDCCACPVAPNGLAVLGIVKDVLAGRKPAPKSVVLKVMASTGGGNAVDCNAATVGTGANVLATGMLPFKGESPFTPSTLSAAELNTLLTQCGFLHPDANICPACRPPTP